MKRIIVLNALERIAVSLGYRFHAGTEERSAPRTEALPAVWVTPMRLKQATGRREHRDTYGVRVRLVAACPAGEAETVWQQLENDAATLFAMLGREEEIRDVREVKVTPDVQPVLLREAVSVTAECKVVVCYRNA